MNDSGKWDDKTIAAVSTAAIMLGALLYYWVGQGQSTVELLELAYGSFKFFNKVLKIHHELDLPSVFKTEETPNSITCFANMDFLYPTVICT